MLSAVTAGCHFLGLYSGSALPATGRAGARLRFSHGRAHYRPDLACPDMARRVRYNTLAMKLDWNSVGVVAGLAAKAAWQSWARPRLQVLASYWKLLRAQLRADRFYFQCQ